MKFWKIFFLILSGGVLGLIFSVSVGDRIASSLERVPLLKQYKLVSSQAPIVIRTREEVRSRGDEDILAALDKSKRKVSAVFVRDGGQLKFVANALNISSEGVFVTTTSLPSDKEKYVQISGGDMRLVSKQALDKNSGLVFLETSGSGNVTPASFGKSEDSTSGERVLLLSATRNPDNLNAFGGFISEKEQTALELEAGFSNKFFFVQPEPVVLGQAIVNISGDVLGLWNGSRVIPSSAISSALQKFLSGSNNFKHYNFGFAYREVSGGEMQLLGLSKGVVVIRVAGASPAASSGLKVGDLVYKINDQEIASGDFLEKAFSAADNSKPFILNVKRDKQDLKISLQPKAD